MNVLLKGREINIYTALVFVFNAGARELKVVFNEMWREEGL